eukprot:m.54030 g.54030  ORF g.54030 m.54030 type:complete len:205 (-) comp9177_c0_seq1:673-1287(-)
MSQAGDEEQWVAAFEKCRGVLALFTQAQSAKDLAAIKQGWLLCLGSHLCPETYPTVAADAKKGAPNKGFVDTVQAAEKSSAWPEFSQCVIARATQGGGDCDAIWDTLKVPRLEWLNAAVQVNTLRRELRSELGRARQADPMAEDTSVKSVWVYGLGHGLPRCNALALGWAKVPRVDMTVSLTPPDSSAARSLLTFARPLCSTPE